MRVEIVPEEQGASIEFGFDMEGIYKMPARMAYELMVACREALVGSAEAVEDVARALHDTDPVNVGLWRFCPQKGEHREQARAILSALGGGK